MPLFSGVAACAAALLELGLRSSGGKNAWCCFPLSPRAASLNCIVSARAPACEAAAYTLHGGSHAACTSTFRGALPFSMRHAVCCSSCLIGPLQEDVIVCSTQAEDAQAGAAWLLYLLQRVAVLKHPAARIVYLPLRARCAHAFVRWPAGEHCKSLRGAWRTTFTGVPHSLL